MYRKILNFVLLVLLIKETLQEEETNPYLAEQANEQISSHFEEEIQRIKSIYMGSGTQSMFERNIELFLPKYDFQRPEKFKKESYSKLYRMLSDSNKRIDGPRDVFIYPEDIIEENEFLYKKELLENIIKKEVNMEDLNYDSKYDIYAYPDSKRFENELPKFINSEDPNMKIKDFAEISDFIQFDQKELLINEKPICIPTMKLLNVKNTMNENLILRSVKSDLYQVTMFYYRPGTAPSQSYNQKNVYPKTIQPGEMMIFQLIILPDIVGKFKGNIYLEFNDNKVVVFPLIVNSVENVYRIHPIYSYSWLGSKLLQIPISIYNPHSKTLIVKEVINSFSSINLVWPNGQSVSSNHTSISSSMLEIPPKANKNLMMINFYKEVPGIEYGLLQMKTDKDTLIIPVLIRVEIQGVKMFPNYYNFGLIDLNKNIKRLIPITLHNVSKQPLQIKALYSTFEENLIEFIPNVGSTLCPSSGSNVNLSPNMSPNTNVSPILNANFVNQYYPNFCVMSPGESQMTFGYLMLDPNNYVPELNDQLLYKKVRGSFILQTNFTENPFIEMYYEYYLDKNTLINNVGIADASPDQFHLFYETGPNAKASYKYEVSVKIKSPFTFNLANSFLNQLEEDSLNTASPSRGSKHNNSLKDSDSLYIIPECSQITARYTEHNDTLKFKIALDNPNTFFNRKNYFFAVKTNLNLFTLIPIKIYDKSVDLHYCDSFQNYKECQNENFSIFRSVNFKNTVINVDFGMISTSETGKKYFSIFNDNKENISISDIETTKGNLILGLESYEDIHTNEKFSNVSKFQIWDNGNLQRRIKKKFVNNEKEIISVLLIPNTYITFSINVNSGVEGDLNGSLNLFFDNPGRGKIKLTINVTAKFYRGNLNISPSVIRFEPAFPGFYQSKLVSSKSSYNIPINIHSVKSFDQRIIPVLLTNSIISNNRTEILKVIFDPSKVSLEENFMKGEMVFNVTSRYLTFKELYLWKEKQKLWELLGSQGRTEINTSVKIKTNLQSETVNVRAFLTKPSLVKKDVIDFGLVQIGESQSRYIEVYNPSDEPMMIQVLLASEEFSDIYNNTMFTKNRKFRFTPENGLTMMDCHFFNITSFDPLSSNFTQNSIFQKNLKRKKRKPDEDIGLDPANSIIIEEDLPQSVITNRQITKTDLLKKLFLYASPSIKQNFVLTERMICNSNFMKKNEIILNNYKELTEKIFSNEFNKEIGIVKKMTECAPPSYQKKEGKENNFGLFERIAQLLKIFFKTELPHKKRKFENETRTQEFYLPKILSSQVYNIKPHQKLNIGPIIFYPSSLSNNSATLFIKNNLTILYPLKLKGNGGSGVLNFSVVERDFNNTNPYSFIEMQIENNLVIDVDSAALMGQDNNKDNDVITKVLKLKNQGNLPVKINNISIENSGCEAYGIKIHKCEGIYLKPDESYKMHISVKPDFNFYFMEKEIIFETSQKIISLKVSISISNELLNYKNRLFNFDYMENYGYISILVVIFIVSVILYILSIEYAEMTDKREIPSLQFLSSKEIIENNPTLQFENLFIKSYRKFNQGFYDDFVYKQFDKPGTGTYDIEGLNDKRKPNNKPTRELSREDFKDKEGVSKEGSVIICEKKESKGEDSSTNNVKDSIHAINVGAKISILKKEKESTTRGKKEVTATAGVKKVTKKPIGMGLKANEKREDMEVRDTSNVTNALKKTPADYVIPPNKFDNCNQLNPYQKYTPSGSYFNKDDYFTATAGPGAVTPNPENANQNLNPNPNPNPNANYYNYENENSIYQPQGYWPKNYTNYTYNASTAKPGYVHYNTGNRYGGNYYTTNQNYYNAAYSGINKPAGHTNLIPYEKLTSANNLDANNTITNKPIDNNPPTDNESKADEAIKSTQKITTTSKKESFELEQGKSSLKYGEETNAEVPKSVTNLKEQFLAFVPDVFSKKNESPSEQEISPEIPPRDKTQSVSDTTPANENVSGQQFNNFNMDPFAQSFKSNFDFTNIFAKPEPEAERVKENISEPEPEDNKNFQDEDASSHNYQSEREKFIDSGTDDFKFNFNSIFNQNNMKFTMTNYTNDYTDNEEAQPKDGNKPYFDKNLFFSFDSAFVNNKPTLFTSDPFAGTNNKKSLLSELRDEDNNLMDNEEERNRLDDVAENEDEDDEEDPLWNEDVVDVKREGFFDETGTYKIKQMDFNFNFDYDFKRK